jgi:hypothetical protein
MSMSIPLSASKDQQQRTDWHSFEDILQRLHQEGIYIRADQLAEFFVAHGLPVDLLYVPLHLKSKAARINTNYQGDMARLEEKHEQPWFTSSLE